MVPTTFHILVSSEIRTVDAILLSSLMSSTSVSLFFSIGNLAYILIFHGYIYAAILRLGVFMTRFQMLFCVFLTLAKLKENSDLHFFFLMVDWKEQGE